MPDDSDLKDDLVNSLPQEIRGNLLWRASGDETFSAFKNHIRTTANSMLYHRGKVAPLNNLQEGEYPEDIDNERNYDEAIAAVQRRFGKGGCKGGRTDPRRPPLNDRDGKGKGDGKGSLRCGNCGGEHGTRNCTKPMLPPEKRLCFRCNEAGHMSKNCPKQSAQPRGALRNVDEVSATSQDYVYTTFGCVDFASPKRL